MIKIKFLVFTFLLPILVMAQTSKKVAVYVMGGDVGVSKVLGSKLQTAIASSEGYTAIERTASFLAELSKEQKYQRTGAVDDSDISRLGKQFGVQYVCVAAISEAFNEKYITARLIDVESAQVEGTASSSGAIRGLPDIMSAANTVSDDLLSSLKNGKQSSVKKVAVYIVKNDRVLGDKLVAAFTNSGRYVAIERTNGFLAQLGKEQKYQRTGAVDDSDISRLGKQFGVQYVCVADVSDVFGEKFISTRLIDVETAEIVNSYDAGGAINKMEDCVRIANEISSKLSKGTFTEQAAEREANKVFDVAEEMPELLPCTYEITKEKVVKTLKGPKTEYYKEIFKNPGGSEGLLLYLNQKLRYPAVAEENGIQGRVVCTFVVERDGSISNVQVVRSIDPSLDKEAVRVIKSMPKWKSGYINGTSVRVKYTIPITFTLR